MIIFQPRFHRWQRVDYRRWGPRESVPSPVWSAVRETLTQRHICKLMPLYVSHSCSHSLWDTSLCVRNPWQKSPQPCLVLMSESIIFISCLTLCCCWKLSIDDFVIEHSPAFRAAAAAVGKKKKNCKRKSLVFRNCFVRVYLLVQKGFSFFLFVWLVVFAHLLLSVYTHETNTIIIKAYYYKPHCRNTTQYTVAHLFSFFFFYGFPFWCKHFLLHLRWLHWSALFQIHD